MWSCCGAVQRGASGCGAMPEHSHEEAALLEANLAFAATPAAIPAVAKRRAVVLDCEMGGDRFNRSELILLSVVDFFSAEVLFDTLVDPSTPICDWRSRWSGVTKRAMDGARTSSNAVSGWRAARSLVLSHIDANTVAIGFALENDLDQLRLVHPNFVDARLAIPCLTGNGNKHGVRSLTAELLGKTVQIDARGHNCLEDTFAARELMLWCLRNPEKVERRRKQSRALLSQHHGHIMAIRDDKCAPGGAQALP